MHTLGWACPLVVEFHLLLKLFGFVHLNVLGLVVFTKVVALLCFALPRLLCFSAPAIANLTLPVSKEQEKEKQQQ